MGLFNRRKKSEPVPEDRVEWVVATARRLFAEGGLETTIVRGTEPENVALLASERDRYPLTNLIAIARAAPAEDALRIIRQHVDGLLASRRDPTTDTLTAEQLRQQVRTRLLPANSGGDGRPDMPTFRYARAFSDGLILALCVDFPQSVQYVTDANITDLALGLDELYAFGQLNTDAEPIDDVFEPVPGIHVVLGKSLFVASKAANLPAVFGAAPFGTLFTVPYRGMLVALPVIGVKTVVSANALVGFTAQVLSKGPVPGGPLSSEVYFSRHGHVTQVSRTTAEGAMAMHAEGPLEQALMEAERTQNEGGAASGSL